MASGVAAAPAARQVLRVVIHTMGKPREAGWESLAAAEYARRLERGARPLVLARTSFHPTGEALARAAARLTPPVVVLDQDGDQPTTEEFAELLFGELLAAGPRVSFVIGGASGLPEPLRLRSQSEGEGSLPAAGFRRLSLSRLTFPHRVARVLLLEQIFRARELRAGTGYHTTGPGENSGGCDGGSGED